MIIEIDGERVLHYITEETVRRRAENILDRELTPDELEDISDKIFENYWHVDEMISESIEEVISFNDLLKRNQKAETKSTHYLVYWKNESISQKDYKKVFASVNEEDAREYIDSQFVGEFACFKISKIDRNTETEIAIIQSNEQKPDGF